MASKNNYISAYHDRGKDKIYVWERDAVTGKRVYKEKNPAYYFYIEDSAGTFDSLDGKKLSKLTFPSKTEFEDACRAHKNKYESDISPLAKFFMDEYYGVEAPNIVYGLIDIEVNYSSKIGFSSPKNPYAEINAITIYRSDLKKYFALVLPPPGWIPEEIKVETDDGTETEVIICSSEAEILEAFVLLINECDVLSGWNSDFFDMPYIAKRLEIHHGYRGLKMLEFDYSPPPRWSERRKFKHSDATEMVIDLQSRIHLDYMRLFTKFNQGGRESFALAAIADSELDIPKIQYDGTLENLYNTNFPYFVKYNVRDVEIIKKLEDKFKYIALANRMSHEATVEFDAVFGSVKLIDTAILNFGRHELKKIVYDRRAKVGTNVEGAVVISPIPGLRKYVATIDINSLYPSIYRALNLSPEKIVGQFSGYEEDWHTLRKANLGEPESETKYLKLRLEETNEEIIQTASDFLQFFKDNKMAVSGYGTVLDQGNGQGLLPAVLSFWFKNRKELQAKKKEFGAQARARLAEVNNNKEDAEYVRLRAEEDYYDMIQNIRKLLLNSSYGATLNEYCKFFDPRLGASTTGSGRQITQEMFNHISIQLTGTDEYKLSKTSILDKEGNVQNIYQTTGPTDNGPIYGDTDSCFFSLEKYALQFPADQRNAEVIKKADELAAIVNENFVTYMRKSFLCTESYDTLIRGNREVVSTSMIIQAKKKYVMNVIDIEGVAIPLDNPKSIKTMGSDIKMTSTPKVIRNFIKEVSLDILRETRTKSEIEKFIVDFRKKISIDDEFNPLDFASISSINDFEAKYEQWKLVEKGGGGKVNLPGAIRSAVNHNEMVEFFKDTETKLLKSGDKVKRLWLKPNNFNLTSMAFSTDQDKLPDWFHDNFEIDKAATEQKLIDQKLKNILDAIGWEVPTVKTMIRNRLVTF